MATLNLNEKKIPSAENLRLIAQLCISLANKQSSLEDRCIAPWKSGEVYQKDISYVSHDGYIYLCSVSNNDTDFTESHWTKLSDTISELTKSDIEALVNLTPEQITNLQSLIDDTSISTTHTNSSSHIYMAIQDAIAECKDDTLKQIAKKVSGSYKIANTTADIVSADYIYLLSNGSNYDLYVLVDGTATRVGDTNIDLSEYVKTTDLADYMKTSDADGKFATITTVEGTLGNLNALVDTKLPVVTSLPASPSNQETVLYVGTSSGGLKTGGIYQYQVSEWVLISYAESFTFNENDFNVDSSTDEVSLLPSRRVFNGTKADWDLLSVAEKTQYGATAFTDDEGGKYVDTYSTDEVKTNEVWIDGKPIYRKVFYSETSAFTNATQFPAPYAERLVESSAIYRNDYSNFFPESMNLYNKGQANAYFQAPSQPYAEGTYWIAKYTKTTD